MVECSYLISRYMDWTEQNDTELTIDDSGIDSITFTIESAKPQEVMKITKGTFYWKGEPVEDKHEIYERFHEWMTMAEQEQRNV